MRVDEFDTYLGMHGSRVAPGWLQLEYRLFYG